MQLFDEARQLFRSQDGLVAATVGLACVFTSMGGMRLNTIDGIYPVDFSLIVRHLLGCIAAVALIVVYRRKRSDCILSKTWRPVLLLATCYALMLLFRYSMSLFIASSDVVVMVGKLLEEFFGVLLLLAWAEQIIQRGFAFTMGCMAGASALLGVFQVVLSFFQRVPCMIVLVMLPVISAVIFRSFAQAPAAARAQHCDEDARPAAWPIDVESGFQLALYIAFVVCCVFLSGQILHPTLELQQQGVSSQLSIALGNVLGGLLLLALLGKRDLVRQQPRLSFTLLLLMISAMDAIAFFLMNYLDGISVTVYLALASVGIQLVLVLVWALPFAQKGSFWSPCMLIALGYAANLGARVFSTLSMNLASQVSTLPLWLITCGVLIAVIALGIAVVTRLPSDTVASAMPSEPVGEGGTRTLTPFKTAIACIEASYVLTAQESRVLGLCAKGKNAQAIATEMGVSSNTVKSHMRTLYAKLGIHSQQELIGLVDEQTARARSLGE